MINRTATKTTASQLNVQALSVEHLYLCLNMDFSYYKRLNHGKGSWGPHVYQRHWQGAKIVLTLLVLRNNFFAR